MSISAKHSLAKKKERRFTSVDGVANTQIESFMKADELVELVYVDICNGVSRRDCQQKLSVGGYGNKPMSARQARCYYTAALDQLAENTDIEAKKMKDILFSRYESLFETAVQRNDIYNAKGILDSMAKIFGLENKTPQTAIQINSNEDGKIVVNFGLSDDSAVQD